MSISRHYAAAFGSHSKTSANLLDLAKKFRANADNMGIKYFDGNKAIEDAELWRVGNSGFAQMVPGKAQTIAFAGRQAVPRQQLRDSASMFAKSTDATVDSPFGFFQLDADSLKGIMQETAAAVRHHESYGGKVVMPSASLDAQREFAKSIAPRRTYPVPKRLREDSRPALEGATVAHELFERSNPLRQSMRGGTFFSHISPQVLLKEHNLLAKATGPGSAVARNITAGVRHGTGESDLLSQHFLAASGGRARLDFGAGVVDDQGKQLWGGRIPKAMRKNLAHRIATTPAPNDMPASIPRMYRDHHSQGFGGTGNPWVTPSGFTTKTPHTPSRLDGMTIDQLADLDLVRRVLQRDTPG
jgi:hypothetical protein